MQKDNSFKDDKVKALSGSVGLVLFIVVVFIFSSRLWPTPKTQAQTVRLGPGAADTVGTDEKKELQDVNRAKDSLNLYLSKQLSRSTAEIQNLVARKKKRQKNKDGVNAAGAETLYIRQGGEIVLDKQLSRDGGFLILDADSLQAELTRAEQTEAIQSADTLSAEPHRHSNFRKVIHFLTNPFSKRKNP